jgi:hypothetical protein
VEERQHGFALGDIHVNLLCRTATHVAAVEESDRQAPETTDFNEVSAILIYLKNIPGSIML